MSNLANATNYADLGYTKDGKVYLKSSLGKPDRIIGDVKTLESEAIDYFVKRFDLIQNKVDTMLEAMDKAENKGSYLMQVIHLKDTLFNFNAIGPFEILQNKLESAEEKIMELIEVNRVKNFELKKQLLETAKIELENPDVKEAIKGMKEVRFSWMTIGSTSKDVEEGLEGEFQVILDAFQIIKDKYTEERTIEIEIRKQKLQILLDMAAKLNTYPPEVEQSYYKIQKLENEWKAVGNIPKVYYGPLFAEFKQIKKTITKYARKGQQGGRGPSSYGPRPIQIPKFYPPQDAPLIDNLRRRVDLIEEAKSLLNMDLRQANEMAKDIQARWKVAGQIPDSFKSEVFNQFNAISDRIFESSYLARVVFTKYPHFRTMAPAEQLEAKIESMDDIILKEDMNVKITQAEFDFMSAEERATDENRSRFSRLNTSVRKLKMKHKILSEMKRELDRMKGGGNSYGYDNRGGGGGYQQRSGGYNNDRPSGSGYGNRYGNESRPYNNDRGSESRPYNNDRGGESRPSYDRPNYPPRSNSGSGYGNAPGYSNPNRNTGSGYGNQPSNPENRPDRDSGSTYSSDSFNKNNY